MSNKAPFPDPANARALLDEADIGSGEKTPGEQDTEAIIRAIPTLPDDNASDSDEPGDRARQLDPAPPKS